jgi:hypothetical protein
MFFHPHLMDSFLGNRHTLMDSVRLIAALAVEEERQEARRKEQLEKSCDCVAEHSKVKPLGFRR